MQAQQEEQLVALPLKRAGTGDRAPDRTVFASGWPKTRCFFPPLSL